jgi:hypothetical protein
MKMKAIALSILLTTLAFFSCKKEAGQSTLNLRLTDAPATYDEVNIDLKQVQIKMADDSTSWQNLETKAGIYDLLKLQDGVDTLIGTGTFPEGTIKEIRLILGSENTITEGGESYPLTIPSGAESGLKIKINEKLNQDTATLLVDFDAALSVKKEGTGNFKLRPVIKLK